MRTVKTIQIQNNTLFKQQLLKWAQQFKHVVWLDSNSSNRDNSDKRLSEYDAILAVDANSVLEVNYKNAFEHLKTFHARTNDYIFGYLGYDLKNDIENLKSTNPDGLDFEDVSFFQPKKIFFLKGNSITLHYLNEYASDIDVDIQTISNLSLTTEPINKADIKIKLRIHKDEYFNKVDSILNHIHRGDIYEVSFCQEFYAENAEIDPLKVYTKLNNISTAPFASFLKLNTNYLLSASPERFLKRNANKVISQPIKGTIKRGASAKEDEQLKIALNTDPKERAENIMIVDLVRNDLSRTAIKGSVKVSELCKVYSFKQVHQLISTVVSEVKTDQNSIDIIKSMFPMGSMTGAPKIAAMKIIEDLEETKRGLFSGAVGYLTPIGDFDFNVVIRSILYNAEKKYISYSVGGAITSKSIPEKEYEECLLKAKAMREVLLNTN